jgi:hypothetical protein
MRVTGALEVAAALQRLAGDVADLEPPNRDTGDELAGIARDLAPVATARLVKTIRSQATATGVVVEAGAGLEYAQVQNKGWPGHNIEGTHYFDEAEEQAERVARARTESHLERAVRVSGLT